MTTDPKDALPPRLDPACTCICHSQPGVMHVAPCCWEADPKDVEIARLVAELAESEAAAEGAFMILAQTQAERDAALAQVAEQKSVLSEILEWSHRQLGLYPDWHDRLRKVLGQFDGDAGLPGRDAQMRAEGRKDGLREAAELARGMNNGETAKAIRHAILAAAKREET